MLLATTAAFATPAPAPKPDPKKTAASKDSKKTATKPAAKPAAKSTAKTTPAKPAAKTAKSLAPDPKPTGSISAPAAPALSGSLGAVQSAMQLVKRESGIAALAAADNISDPMARSLIMWAAIRMTARDVGFDRAYAYMRAHPTLPTPTVLRRRLEFLLLAENDNPSKVLAFFSEQRPISGEGKIALARALAATGDRNGAAAWARDAYREDTLSQDLEIRVLADFNSVITRADHKYRADKFFYAEDGDRGMRAAQFAGADVVALGRARMALANRSGDPAKLLAAVPASLRSDPAYLYTQAKIMRRAEDYAGAARVLMSAPADPEKLVDPDQWWIERRLIARELLDLNDPRGAYQIARAATLPQGDNYRAEQQFTAGWIALRFLNDPRTAQQHFARVADGQENPIAIARSGYWMGRAQEAAGNNGAARASYEAAAQHGTTYYGQLARARIGRPEIGFRNTPDASMGQRAAAARDEGVQILKLLYQLGERDLAIAVAADLAERLPDAGTLGIAADIVASNKDARNMVVMGKLALGRGLPFETTAYPTIGLPRYSPIGPNVDSALSYAIARQESQFNPRVVSSARAMGLMQVTPAAGKYVAGKYGVGFNEGRLLSDQTYNVQLGSAELGGLLDSYGGSYVLTFAAYNAGRGSVAKWIARYGDPRDPGIDPIDWVERIPFSETRNYVQRVMENAQVYKYRFNGRGSLQIEADLRGTRM